MNSVNFVRMLVKDWVNYHYDKISRMRSEVIDGEALKDESKRLKYAYVVVRYGEALNPPVIVTSTDHNFDSTVYSICINVTEHKTMNQLTDAIVAQITKYIKEH